MIEYVTILNKEREKIGIIDLFNSILWAKDYYGTGDFEIFAEATEENLALLKVGNMVTRDEDEDVGIIERVEHSFSVEQGIVVTASGRFAKCFLGRRLIYRLSGNQNAATTMSGKVESAVRKLVNNNLVSPTDANRQIAFIKLGDEAGISKVIVQEDGESGRKQTTYDNLLEYTDELLAEYQLGAKMPFGADKIFRYTVYEGKDRTSGNTQGNTPVIFSQQFDNLKSSTYTEDETDMKTTALVGGEGEGLARFYSLYGGSYEGAERREMFVDASSVNKTYKDDSDTEQTYTDEEYTALLNSEARQALEEVRSAITFSGEVDITNSQYEYRVDYNVGDLVTMRDETIGVELSVRIIRLIEAQDENGYSIDIEYAN